MAIKTNASQSIVTRDLAKLTAPTGNIYEGIVIVSHRAKQISSELKEELSNKLLDFSGGADTLEEVYENREQIEISRYYERLPKATNIAMEEFLEGKLMFKYPEPPVQ
jgi:DNA-directed RNA polymerase subunit K/omega